jgi:hypothetical protein
LADIRLSTETIFDSFVAKKVDGVSVSSSGQSRPETDHSIERLEILNSRNLLVPIDDGNSITERACDTGRQILTASPRTSCP